MADQQVRAVVDGALSSLGISVAEVTLTPAGRRRVLRVVVERALADIPPQDETTPIPPLTLDEVADASRAVEATLDETDAMGATPYVLEVSSAGVGRPMREWASLRRNVGRLVSCRLLGGEEVTGRLTGVATDHVRVSTADGGERRLEMGDLDRAVVEVEFGREDEAGDASQDDRPTGPGGAGRRDGSGRRRPSRVGGSR